MLEGLGSVKAQYETDMRKTLNEEEGASFPDKPPATLTILLVRRDLVTLGPTVFE